MPQLIDPKSYVRTLPFPAVHLLGTGEGDLVQPLDLEFRWKLKGQETGFLFSVYEMVLPPEKKVPLHIRPFSEFFYVLEGRLDVMSLRRMSLLEFGDSRALSQGTSADRHSPDYSRYRRVDFLGVLFRRVYGDPYPLGIYP